MLDRMIATVEKFNLRMGTLGGLITVALTATIVPDVIARSFFNTALYGMSETSVLLLVLMVYVGLPGAQVLKGHYRITIIDNLIGPTGRRALEIVRHAICLAVGIIFTWYAAGAAWSSTANFESSYAVIRFPVWPGRIVIAVGLALLTIQFMIDLIQVIRGRSSEALSRADEHVVT